MSQTLLRNFETDGYKTLSSNSNNDAETEKSIVQALVKASLDASENAYTCPANNTTWDYFDLSSSYINTSAIFNYPAGTVTKNSVISVDLSNNDLSFNTYSTKIASVGCNNNNYTFSSLPTSTPYYDCNYVVTQSIIRTAYDASSNVSFSFDLSNSNVKVQNAAQSRWNTTTAFNPNMLDTSGSDPLTVTQDVTFNTLSAFGQQGTAQTDTNGSEYTSNWATMDPTDGSIIFQSIDVSNQPIDKNIFVKDRVFSSGGDLSYNTDVGIFRLQQPSPQITTKLNGTSITNNDLLNIPLFDATPALLRTDAEKKANSLDYCIPGNMTSLEFNTLVSQNVRNVIQTGWNYSIDISSNGGGYTIDNPNGVLGTIDNNDIKDNLYYMENYVDQEHRITITNGSVTVNHEQPLGLAGNIAVDSTHGETLNFENAGNNGEIKIDNRSIDSRTLQNATNNIDSIVNVYYDDSLDTTFIDAGACTSNTFNVFWKKVTQDTSQPETSFVSNNDAVLNLYTDKLVDASYNTTDFVLSFNSTLDASLSDINIWKINLVNNLVSHPDSFYSDASYATRVDTIKASVLIPLLGDASYNFPYNNYRLQFTAKKIEDLSIHAHASSVGCELFYDDSADTFLKTSNEQAFEKSAAWPHLIEGQAMSDISYSVSYGTVLQSLTSGGTLDSVTVSYTDLDGVSHDLIIPQSEIKRTGISSSVTYTDVSGSSYNLTNARHGYKLVRKEIEKVFDAEFYLKMRLYTNVKAKINNITQKTTMYVLQNSEGTYEPRSRLHDEVTSETLPNLYNVIETLERQQGLIFSGTLSQLDLDPAKVVLQYSDSQDNWSDLSEPVSVNVYYGLDVSFSLATSGSMIVNINYEMNDTDVNVTNLTNEHYYIPLTIDGNATHSLCSFQADASDIATKTSLSSETLASNTTYLTVTDNYAAANADALDYSKYNLDIQKTTTDYTLTVSDGSNTLFTIHTPNNSVFFGDMIVSRNKKDIYYAQKQLDNSLTELYETVDYTSKLQLPGIPGIYITQPINGMDYNSSVHPPNGSYQQFRVLGDMAAVNLVGSAGTLVELRATLAELQENSMLSYTGTGNWGVSINASAAASAAAVVATAASVAASVAATAASNVAADLRVAAASAVDPFSNTFFKNVADIVDAAAGAADSAAAAANAAVDAADAAAAATTADAATTAATAAATAATAANIADAAAVTAVTNISQISNLDGGLDFIIEAVQAASAAASAVAAAATSVVAAAAAVASAAETTVIITLPAFRGYYSTGTYEINRTSSVANFLVGSNNPLNDVLTTNMYANEQYTVNDLRDVSGNKIADLNLKGTFNYSIMPDNKPNEYSVTVTGDPLTVTIVNPNYSGNKSNIDVLDQATNVNANEDNYTMTLKDYGKDNVYTFSGEQWHLTNSFMKIRPSRVKLTNSSYTLSTLSYDIDFKTDDLKLYVSKGNNWLGNPSLLDSQDPNIDPLESHWQFIRGYTLSDLNNGISIGVKTLFQPRELSSDIRIMYFVSVPPYYKYQQMSTVNCLNIPYDFSVDQATTRYHPYTGLTNSYNPFSEDLSFNDICGNVITINNNEIFLNDVTFTFEDNIPTLLDLRASPRSAPISANVKGTNIKVDLYEGLYPSTDPGSHTNPVYDGPITEIPSTPDITKNGVIFQSRDPSGGINFGLLQYPSDVGLSNNEASYAQLLKTTNKNDWYNINMNMGNASWFNDNSGVTYFDMNGTGVEATLYTVLDANDPTTQTNFRRVYKYYSNLKVNINSDPPSNIETVTIPFISREYYDHDISSGLFTGSLGSVWNYQDILEQTNISGSQISWTPDISFNENAYVGWSFGNSETSKNIIRELLYLQDERQKKWTFVTLEPFMTYKNQFGLDVGSVAWDGSITTQLINTRTVSLSPAITNPVLNPSKTSTIQQHSSSSITQN